MKGTNKSLPMVSILSAVLTMLACGCGDSGIETKFEGIYQIDSWTENLDACDLEGPSIMETQSATMMFVRVDNFIIDFLSAMTCLDLENCRQEAADDSFNLSAWAFDTGNDGSGWYGSGTSAYSSGDGPCRGEVWQVILTSPEPDHILLAVETTQVEGFEKDADGFCDLDAAESLAQGQPCNSLEVIKASFVENLPGRN